MAKSTTLLYACLLFALALYANAHPTTVYDWLNQNNAATPYVPFQYQEVFELARHKDMAPIMLLFLKTPCEPTMEFLNNITPPTSKFPDTWDKFIRRSVIYSSDHEDVTYKLKEWVMGMGASFIRNPEDFPTIEEFPSVVFLTNDHSSNGDLKYEVRTDLSTDEDNYVHIETEQLARSMLGALKPKEMSKVCNIPGSYRNTLDTDDDKPSMFIRGRKGCSTVQHFCDSIMSSPALFAAITSTFNVVIMDDIAEEPEKFTLAAEAVLEHGEAPYFPMVLFGSKGCVATNPSVLHELSLCHLDSPSPCSSKQQQYSYPSQADLYPLVLMATKLAREGQFQCSTSQHFPLTFGSPYIHWSLSTTEGKAEMAISSRYSQNKKPFMVVVASHTCSASDKLSNIFDYSVQIQNTVNSETIPILIRADSTNAYDLDRVLSSEEQRDIYEGDSLVVPYIRFLDANFEPIDGCDSEVKWDTEEDVINSILHAVAQLNAVPPPPSYNNDLFNIPSFPHHHSLAAAVEAVRSKGDARIVAVYYFPECGYAKKLDAEFQKRWYEMAHALQHANMEIAFINSNREVVTLDRESGGTLSVTSSPFTVFMNHHGEVDSNNNDNYDFDQLLHEIEHQSAPISPLPPLPPQYNDYYNYNY